MATNTVSRKARRPMLACVLIVAAGLMAPSSARAAGFIAKVQLQQLGVAYFIAPTVTAQNILFGQTYGGNVNGFLYINFFRDVNQNITGGTWVWSAFSGGRYMGSAVGVVARGAILEPPATQGLVLPAASFSADLLIISGSGIFGGNGGVGALGLTAFVDNSLGAATGGALPYQVRAGLGVIAVQTQSNLFFFP
jgi:hypothetical protein